MKIEFEGLPRQFVLAEFNNSGRTFNHVSSLWVDLDQGVAFEQHSKSMQGYGWRNPGGLGGDKSESCPLETLRKKQDPDFAEIHDDHGVQNGKTLDDETLSFEETVCHFPCGTPVRFLNQLERCWFSGVDVRFNKPVIVDYNWFNIEKMWSRCGYGRRDCWAYACNSEQEASRWLEQVAAVWPRLHLSSEKYVRLGTRRAKSLANAWKYVIEEERRDLLRRIWKAPKHSGQWAKEHEIHQSFKNRAAEMFGKMTWWNASSEEQRQDGRRIIKAVERYCRRNPMASDRVRRYFMMMLGVGGLAQGNFNQKEVAA